MDNLYHLLLQVHKEPYKYLNRPTLDDLYTFISGYIVFMNYIDREIHYDFFQEFQKFIEDKFQINLSLHHTTIIEFYCRDKQEAFDRYFELLDEYLYYKK